MVKASTAVVLLNYNSVNYLQEFLPVLIGKTPNWATVYVIDNASTDNSVAYLEKSFPAINLIKLTENYGYAGGYYHGLKQIKEEFLVLINTDVEVTENWLPPLIEQLKNNDQLAAVQPKIKSFHHKNQFEHAGAAGGFIDFLGYPFCRGRLFDVEETDNGQYDNTIDCFWASGACFAVKKIAYDEAGGFDPRFFMHMEEIDLCWRMQRLGYRVTCEPKSVVYHVGGGTLPYESPKKFYYNFRNNLVLLQKNVAFPNLITTLIIRCMLDWLAACRELTKGKWQNTVAVGKAWLSFLIKFWSWREKFNHKKQQKISSIYKKSILVDFFFLNNRIYSSLRHKINK